MLTPSQTTIILGLLMVIVELFVGIQTGFDLVVIGSILILSGFLGIATSSFNTTLIASSILAIVYLALGRRLIRQKLNVLTQKTNIDKLIDAQGVVTKAIDPHQAGIVRLNDEEWRAISTHSLKAGQKVIVTAIEGVSLVVIPQA